MNAPELSIIVPVYQTKKYLNQCVDSILTQDFQKFELLLVDDGSTDGSEKICDEYARHDPRVIVFHQKNHGVSAARNTGLDHARGDYICFVDADDWLKKDLLSSCMNAMKESKADILHHGMTKNIWKNNHVISSAHKYEIPFQGLSDQITLKNLLINHYSEFSVHVFNYIFKKKLLNNKRFEEGISYSEDAIFVNQVLSLVKTCYFLDSYGYQYNARAGSAAYKWHAEMLTFQEKTFSVIRDLLKKFNLSPVEEDNVLGSEIVNAYSAFLYSLCLPSCQLPLFEKTKLAHQARKQFQIKKYIKLYSFENLSTFDRAKLFFVQFHVEDMLIFLGTTYERIITNEKSSN